MEPDNVGVFYPLQQDHFIVNHSFVAFDVLLEYYLYGVSFPTTFGLPDDSICTSTERSSELILSSVASQ